MSSVHASRLPVRALQTAALLVGLVSIAVAAEWPTFTPGRWQFDRTITEAGQPPRKVSSTDCTDPTTQQRTQRATLTKAGCQFSPLTQTGSTYRYSATCKMAGMTSTSSSVLEASSAEAYTITVDSVTNGAKSHEVVTARRLGSCTK